MSPESDRRLAETLVSVGMMMMWLCGLCGGGFFVTGIWSEIDGRDREHWGQPIALASLVMGGLPAAIGFGLYRLGRIRSARLDAAIAKSEAP